MTRKHTYTSTSPLEMVSMASPHPWRAQRRGRARASLSRRAVQRAHAPGDVGDSEPAKMLKEMRLVAKPRGIVAAPVADMDGLV
ncbi:hypothetical protein GY45DRAFT_1319979 [Cubamyces sp. BRFM 1775]|nr:hypothetical protein GY45DRAFT_1319979 [Cubamyces sp. BRFM 1775]